MVVKKESPALKYTSSLGRRKTAIAQVRLMPGSGILTLNNKVVVLDPRLAEPLEMVGVSDKYDISVIVRGGGKEGQVIAIRHGIARALVKINEDFKTTLKKAGFITRDSRERERKKFGLKSARRAPQFSKR
jgi:small subunit ribosomal protein S9